MKRIGDEGRFLVVALVLFVLGPIVSLPFFLLSSSPLLSYCFIFIPYILAFLSIGVLSGWRIKEESTGVEGREFSSSKFIFLSAVSLIFLTLVTLPESPREYEASLGLKLSSLLISLLFIPIQTGVEEYLFRVLPLRVGERWIKERKGIVPLSILSGALFTIPHLLNSEVWAEGGLWAILHYFLWGTLAMAISIVSGGFEASYAMHLSNNLFAAVAVGYVNSSLSSVPFFIVDEETSSPKAILSFIILFVLTGFLSYIWDRREEKKRRKS